MNITNKIVALSSAVAFALQITLALLMLRYFSPEEVGMFSVISQIGFFWTTLALAQTPLQLLANHGASVLDDARHAWILSMQRFVWLVPVAALAVWWSDLSFVSALMWALLLSLCQLTWMLAQSMRLRMVNLWALASVRVLPPLASLLFVGIAVLFSWGGPALQSAALFGYATGAIWLLLIIFHLHPSSTGNRPTYSGFINDDRTTSLRIGHALVDALLATAVVLLWQRLYGAEETGWMTAPLRVMGFFPALMHTAWAQVFMAQPQQTRTNSLWVGLGGFSIVALLGATGSISLKMGWLSSHWQGTMFYLLPLALWQGCACISAAYSHRPFESHVAQRYSWFCMGIGAIQGGVLLAPLISATKPITPITHIWLFTSTSGLGLLAIAYWLANLSPSPEESRIKP